MGFPTNRTNFRDRKIAYDNGLITDFAVLDLFGFLVASDELRYCGIKYQRVAYLFIKNGLLSEVGIPNYDNLRSLINRRQL